VRHVLDEADIERLHALRTHRAAERRAQPQLQNAKLTVGQRVADQVAVTMGSWSFIIVQSVLLAIWIALNITAYIARWDPYPFILLNLLLSFQAAYAAPVIMMSQNRQQDIDRRDAANDYRVNVKAELEIESLHAKIDELREKEVLALTQAVHELTILLQAHGLDSAAPSA
jgi:uncharacterized membrane protein